MRRPASLLCPEALHHRDSADHYPVGVCRAVLERLTVDVVPGWRDDRLARSPIVRPADDTRSTSTAEGRVRCYSRLVLQDLVL